MTRICERNDMLIFFEKILKNIRIYRNITDKRHDFSKKKNTRKK